MSELDLHSNSESYSKDFIWSRLVTPEPHSLKDPLLLPWAFCAWRPNKVSSSWQSASFKPNKMISLKNILLRYQKMYCTCHWNKNKKKQNKLIPKKKLRKHHKLRSSTASPAAAAVLRQAQPFLYEGHDCLIPEILRRNGGLFVGGGQGEKETQKKSDGKSYIVIMIIIIVINCCCYF